MQNIQKHLNDTNRGVFYINNGWVIPGVMGITLESFSAVEEDIWLLINESSQGNISDPPLRVLLCDECARA